MATTEKRTTRMADDDRFLRLPDVERLTGLRKSTIYELITRDEFPDRHAVGPKIVIWLESEGPSVDGGSPRRRSQEGGLTPWTKDHL